MKVYELAKDLNLKSVELLERLRKEHNMQVKNHMQSLSSEEVAKIREFFSQKIIVPFEGVTKKKSTVVRKRKPAVVKKAITPTPETATIPVVKAVSRKTVIRRRASDSKKAQEEVAPLLERSEKAIAPEKEERREDTPTSELASTRHPIRPGLGGGVDQTDVLKQINASVGSVEAEKKKPKKTGLEKEGQTQQFRATDFRKREVIFQPKKKRLSVGLSGKKTQITTPKSHKRVIKIYNNTISLEDMAHQLGTKKKALIRKIKEESLFSDSKIPDTFDHETACLISGFFNFEVKNMIKNKEEAIESLFFGNLQAQKINKPPVVTVMGHVNHGKTTLLDFIRKSRVASGEAGGITQHMGAYSVPTDKSFVTFIDTPGHAAFTSMRERGAQITDIVVIVVAADDGIQPQTIEAINHAKTAKVPIIVAINKVDLSSANVDQTKKQLMEHELVPEDWGGDTIFCSISALKGDGVGDLLEHITLLAEVNELRANPSRSAQGVIIESRLEKGRGWVLTLLVQDGTLKSGHVLIVGEQVGRARQMTDDLGNVLSEAGPGKPVEISGLEGPAKAGEVFYVVKNEKEARRFILEQKQPEQKEEESKLSIEELLFKAHENPIKTLNIVLKTDVVGSKEACQSSIEHLNTDQVEARIIHANIGAVNESDVLLANTAQALLLCFNVDLDPKARKLAQEKSVNIKSYKVIYDLLKEVETTMAGLLDPDIKEIKGGEAEVKQVFSISKVGVIAGCKMIKGKILSSHLARVIREKETIYTGKLVSLKKFKQSAKEVSEGQECGIGLDQYKDFKEGDIIETFTQVITKRVTL